MQYRRSVAHKGVEKTLVRFQMTFNVFHPYQRDCRKANNLCSVAMVVVIFSVSVFAQTTPKTVIDFYLALPGSINGVAGAASTVRGFEDDFIFYSNERNESRSAITKYRKSLIKIEDIKNGYLRLEDRGWEGWMEIALFKARDGSNIVAISQVGCGPGCSGGVLFLEYKREKWINVTREIFRAAPFSDNGYFKLPREGTTIQLLCGDASRSRQLANSRTLENFTMRKC